MGSKRPKLPITALRLLVKDLQSQTRTGKEQGLPNDIAYDDGFSDGQVQAGNDLEALLDEYGLI